MESCPAANALLLGSSQTLTFCTRETAEDGEKSDPWTEALLPVRERMLTLLADRSKRLRKRLADVLLLAAAAQELLDQEEIGKLPALASSWQPKPWAAENGGVFPAVLHVLKGLDILDPAWQTLLDRAEKAAPIPVPDDLLERTAAYFIFRYPLKAVNDGDLLGRVQLCVFGMLTVQKLAPVCGLLCCGAGGFLRVGGADSGAGGSSVRPAGGAAPVQPGDRAQSGKPGGHSERILEPSGAAAAPASWGVGTVMTNFVQSALAVSFYFV